MSSKPTQTKGGIPLAPPRIKAGSRSAGGGRKITARKKLIASAYDIMSRSGLEGSTIADIIERAGVGVGSFYNHFSSKEELARAVFAERAAQLGAVLERVGAASENAAAATCFAYRRMIEEVESDKVWAAFIVQLEPSMQMLDGLLRPHARVGIRSGIERSLLKLDNVEVGITAIHALMVAVARSMISGDLSPQEAHRSSLLALRMFGVDENEAQRLSQLPMTALRHELNLP